MFSFRVGLHIVRNSDRYEVVHFHGVGKQTIVLLAAGRWAGLPVVGKITEMSDDSPSAHLQRAFGRAILKCLGFVDVMVAVAPAIERDIRDVGVWSDVRVCAVPNPVDTAEYASLRPGDRHALRASLGYGDDARVLVGVLDKQKSIDVLRNAWAEIRRGVGGQARLLVVGPRSATGGEERLAALGGVTVAGRLSPEHVRRLLQATDAFVLPTRSERLPNAVLEAMAAGLPCIVGRLLWISDHLLGEDRVVEIDVDGPEGTGKGDHRLGRIDRTAEPNGRGGAPLGNSGGRRNGGRLKVRGAVPGRPCGAGQTAAAGLTDSPLQGEGA